MPSVCLQFFIVVFPDHTILLFLKTNLWSFWFDTGFTVFFSVKLALVCDDNLENTSVQCFFFTLYHTLFIYCRLASSMCHIYTCSQTNSDGSELDWLKVYDMTKNDENIFKDWSQSTYIANSR